MTGYHNASPRRNRGERHHVPQAPVEAVGFRAAPPAPPGSGSQAEPSDAEPWPSRPGTRPGDNLTSMP